MPEIDGFVYDASKIFRLTEEDMGKLARLWAQFQGGLMTPEEYAGEVGLVVDLARIDFDRAQEI